jgi:hypothetical protein
MKPERKQLRLFYHAKLFDEYDHSAFIKAVP